jgi:GT2 family glycosyltransferase
VPPPSPPAVSVIVPTVGRPLLLAECLRSLSACEPPPAEVVVVDQSVGRDVQAVVSRSATGGARLVRSLPLGIAHAVNVGLREARYEIAMITNDDCTVAPDWVEIACSYLASNPCGLVSGRVLPGGEGAWVPSIRDAPEAKEFGGGLDCGALYAGNMAVRRDQALALGGFDERDSLRVAAEDNDFCYRWLKTGRALRYEPAMTVWHHDWRTPEQLVHRYVEYAKGQGAFYAKHLAAGDRYVLRWVWRDLRDGAVLELKRVLRRRSRASVARGANLYWLPVGLVVGWREARRLGGKPPRSRAAQAPWRSRLRTPARKLRSAAATMSRRMRP